MSKILFKQSLFANKTVKNLCEVDMKNTWNDEEITALFNTVEFFKGKNKSLLDAFEFHAQKYNRKPLSVRNFYYLKVDEVLQSKSLAEKFKVNVSMHQKNNFAKFDERQTQKLLDYIKKRTKEGKSVRSACLEIAGNDAKNLVRLQNKYRLETNRAKTINLEKNQRKTTKSAQFCNNLDKKEQKPANNLINFPVEQKLIPQKLTDAEIQSLFLGLVKLVKKSALSEVENQIKQEQEKLSNIVRKSTIEICEKNDKIEKLLGENKKLSTELLKLKSKLEEMRSSTI